jgi:hypothetical protein
MEGSGTLIRFNPTVVAFFLSSTRVCFCISSSLAQEQSQHTTSPQPPSRMAIARSNSKIRLIRYDRSRKWLHAPRLERSVSNIPRLVAGLLARPGGRQKPHVAPQAEERVAQVHDVLPKPTPPPSLTPASLSPPCAHDWVVPQPALAHVVEWRLEQGDGVGQQLIETLL